MHGPINFTPAEIASYYRVRVPDLKQNGHKEWRGACPVHGGTCDSFAVNSEDVGKNAWCVNQPMGAAVRRCLRAKICCKMRQPVGRFQGRPIGTVIAVSYWF